jgi:lipoprotein-releasing system permease protein
MKLPFFIARRYIFSKKSRNTINVITGITIFAIAVISFSLVIILSAVNGFESLLFNLYSDFDPDLKIEPRQGKVFSLSKEDIASIKGVDGVDFVFKSLEDNAVIKHSENQVIATIKGVEEAYPSKSGIEKYIVAGTAELNTKGAPRAVLGAGVDQKLTSDVEDPYSYLSVYVPRRGDYSVKDPDGIQEMFVAPGGVILMDDIINQKYVIVPLDFARELFEREDEVSSVDVLLNEDSDFDQIEASIQDIVGDEYEVKNRFEQQATIFKMFEKEKRSTLAILVLIMMIATFNLVGALTMMVIEKKKDLSTFKAMGGTRNLIKQIYYSEGITISAIGFTIGAILGVILVLLQIEYGLVEMNNAIVDYYPMELKISDLIIVVLVTLTLGVLTSIYPAHMAAKEVSK